MPGYLISIDEFRSAVCRNDAGGAAPVLRLFTTAEPKILDADSRTIRWVFSDSTVDRMTDTIDIKGWDLTTYRANPVVLWAHDASAPPIGNAANVQRDGARLVGDVTFADLETYDFADTIFRLVRGKFIRAGSVGFRPLEWAWTTDKSRPNGIDFKRQELLEFSICPIPANPNALIDARAAGIDTRPLTIWAEKMLDAGAQVLVDREELMALRAAAKPPASVTRAAEADWKVGAARDLPLDTDEGWDGPAAAKAMLDAAGFDGDSPDSEKARRGFLAYDAANPGLRGSYKLPFCRLDGGTLKAAVGGIHAAASRLPDTDIPQTTRDDARAVLDAYEARLSADKSIRRRAAATVARDLSEVGWLAQLLQSLATLETWVAWETESEGDDSPIAARLTAVLQALGQILIDMTAEEVGELLAGTDAGLFDLVMMSARTPGQKALVTLALAVHRAGDFTAKAGRVLSTKNETDLRQARDMIDGVLSQVGASEAGTDDPDDEAKTVAVRQRKAGAWRRRLLAA